MNGEVLIVTLADAAKRLRAIDFRQFAASIEALDTPLRSAAIDGGGRSIGGHSDPTPQAAASRRTSREMRDAYRAALALVEQVAKLERIVFDTQANPPKRGACWVCLRASSPRQALNDTGMCSKCVEARAKAIKRANQRGDRFDEMAWRASARRTHEKKQFNARRAS